MKLIANTEDCTFTIDQCGKQSDLILDINGSKIPMCEDCVNDLIMQLVKHKNTIYCRECINFIKIDDNDRIGMCKVKSILKLHPIDIEDTEIQTHIMNTCANATNCEDDINKFVICLEDIYDEDNYDKKTLYCIVEENEINLNGKDYIEFDTFEEFNEYVKNNK